MLFGLIRSQYAATGNAALHGLTAAVKALSQAEKRKTDTSEPQTAALLEHFKSKLDDIDRYIGAYREYCWTVNN